MFILSSIMGLWDGLWDETLWLPEDVRWTDMKSNATISYPEASDLRYSLLGGVILMVIRICVESFVFLPIGWIGGWVKQPLLERMYVHVSGGFAGKSKFKSVAESAWRYCFYITAFVAGLTVLWNEPQLWDVTECWRNWPYHHVSNQIWWYYIIECSFYWALLFGHIFTDVRRGDFLQMFLHHAVTILLIGISWSMNMVRVGALVLVSHDAGDIFLEATKLVRYAKWNMATNVMFVIFLTVWLATRLFYYPFWVIQSVWFDAPALIQASYRWGNLWQPPLVPRILMAMLSMLLVLHVFWTYLLFKVVVRTLNAGDIDDIREEGSDEEVDEAKIKND